MKCLICGKECIDKNKNICSNCSTSGLEYLEYKENPPVRAKRISFNEYNMEHLYSMAIDNFEDNCVECQQLKKRIEKFLGEEIVKEINNEKNNNTMD